MSTSTPRRSTRNSVTRSSSVDTTSDVPPTTPSTTPSRQRRSTSRQPFHHTHDLTPRRRSARLSATPTPSLPALQDRPALGITIKEEPEGPYHSTLPSHQRQKQGEHDHNEYSDGTRSETEPDEVISAEEEEEEQDVETKLLATTVTPSDTSPPVAKREVRTKRPPCTTTESFVSDDAPTIEPVNETRPKDRDLRRLYIRRKILGAFSSLGPILRPLLIIAALLLMVMLPAPMPPFSKNTYVDENALQPGQANVYWEWAEVGLCDEISREIKALEGDGDPTRRSEYLSSKLRQFGLEPHSQKYHFDIPTEAGNVSASGINIYARWFSARSDGREAVVIAASWLSRWDGSDDPDVDEEVRAETKQGSRRVNNRGVAIALGLSKYLSAQSHWSKDIIFVFSDGYLEGMQAWSTAYFGAKQSNLYAEPLACTGAAVWNAIAIDYPSDSFSFLTLLHDGVDGQLPNMDVLNTLVQIADRMGRVPVLLPGDKGGFGPEDDIPGGTWGLFGRWLEDHGWGWRGVAKYKKSRANLLHQIKSQTIGRPSGIHGVFQRFHVDAITIFAVPAKGPYGFWNLGRILEATMRSFSNLLERLHHSQFFYLLTVPDKFVPLGMYLPVAILLSVASTLTGIAAWSQAGRDAKKRKSDFVEWSALRVRQFVPTSVNGTTSRQEDLSLEFPTHADLQVDLAQVVLKSGLEGEMARAALQELLDGLDSQSRPVASVLSIMGASHAAGAFALSQLLQRHPSIRIASTMLGLTPFITTLIARGWMARHRKLMGSDASHHLTNSILSLTKVLHAFTLLETGIATAVLSILNFSAATVMALLLVLPLYCISVPASGDGQTKKLSKRSKTTAFFAGVGMFLFLSPWNLPYLLQAGMWVTTHVGHLLPKYLPISITRNHLIKVDVLVQWTFDTILTDWYLLGTAFLPIVSLVYTPILLQAITVTLLVVMA